MATNSLMAKPDIAVKGPAILPSKAHGKPAISPLSIVSSPTTLTSSSGTASPLSAGPQQSAMNSSCAVQLPPKTSITSKEWVVPPRPKPGRKPATDIPPTKRKAQNRAAQRAFRERKAARVGELEEQLEEQRHEHERIERELQRKIWELTAQVRSLEARCHGFEETISKQKEVHTAELNEVSSGHGHGQGHQLAPMEPPLPSGANRIQEAQSWNRLPQSGSATTHPDQSILRTASVPQTDILPHHEQARTHHQGKPLSSSGRCEPIRPSAYADKTVASTSLPQANGHCRLGSRCECIETVTPISLKLDLEHKRKHSPTNAKVSEEKRQKPSPVGNETDFTAMFSRGRQPAPSVNLAMDVVDEPLPRPVLMPPRDTCGFCEEGTYCMCADAAASAATASSSLEAVVPVGAQAQTPPAQDTDAGFSEAEPLEVETWTLPGRRDLMSSQPTRSNNGTCGPNGPGTCPQCLADPKSGLFCRSLAACAESSNDPQLNRDKEKLTTTSLPSIDYLVPTTASDNSPPLTLSCADAYKTLSSHRNFDKASEDMNVWLPRLRAMMPTDIEDGGNGRRAGEHEGPIAASGGHSGINAGAGFRGRRRAPIEVEAASIMSVLKDFDVRFGKGV